MAPARWLTLAGLSWAAVAVATIVSLATATLAVMGHDVALLLAPQSLAFAWMGAVLVARRPGHPMGPLLCLIGLIDAVSQLPFAYARYTIVHVPGSLPFGTAALWAMTWVFAPATSLVGLVLPLVFPEGRLLSPRWRPALWAALAFIPLSVAGYAFIPQSMGSLFRNLPDPYTAPRYDTLFVILQGLAVACGLAAAIAAAASVTLRRGGRPDKTPAAQVVPRRATGYGSVHHRDRGRPGPVSLACGLVAGTLLPLAIGVAVLRYKLYEIDILLNRAVLYGLLTAGVAAVYLAVAVGGQLAVRRAGPRPGRAGRRYRTGRRRLVSAARPGAAPGRTAVLRRPGSTYEALARLGRRVEMAADTETALNSVVKTIADSLRLPYAALELRLGDGSSPAAAYGEAPAQVVAFPLTSQRETVGRLLVGTRVPGEQLGPDDERLLADLARQAGPASTRWRCAGR